MEFELRNSAFNEDPADYLISQRLKRAVELSYALNKPLLLTGSPGTGKTQLAHHIANALALQTTNDISPFFSKPIQFNTKSTSTATDLFYYYDAVKHFKSTPLKGTENFDPNKFIELKSLGKAIALANGKNYIKETLVSEQWIRMMPVLDKINELKEYPQSSVVLIDEIDKAPKEFPNDLLNEIASLTFEISELNCQMSKVNNGSKILVILTSNNEKSLPSAFLRRCIFFYIPLPSESELLEIVVKRLGLKKSKPIETAIERFISFQKWNEKELRRVPSTGEFLDWMRVLMHFDLLDGSEFPPKLETEISIEKSVNEGKEGEKRRRELYITSLSVLQKDYYSEDSIFNTSENPLL